MEDNLNASSLLPYLHSTNLDSTNLDSANLDSTNLDSANLDSANLGSANLDSNRLVSNSPGSPGANFFLRISLISEDASSLEKATFPFLVVSDSDPLTRLIEARMLTDSGSEIKRVFLLVQKDQYLLSRDELRPVGNQDIDAFWQRAFSLYESGKGNGSFITLARQIGQSEGDGEENCQKGHEGQKRYLLPFQSLFFCKKKRLFFAPPCPVCGLPIQQCCDDSLLVKLGLQPYSTSLKRYLFCPSCVASGKSLDFYTFGLESFASPGLKDRWDLIRGFRNLIRGEGHPDQRFVCRECPQMQECYGLDSHFLTRIVPFSFYPFCMFIVEAMSLHALDFLALISGASLDEIKTQLESRQELGRAGCLKAIKQYSPSGALIFFDQPEKYFFEVLYLKLSFLGEVIQKISTPSSGSGIGIQPDLGLSLDQIWVNLANNSGLLPLFWSFSVEILSLGEKPSEDSSFSRILPSYGLHVLGLIWFYTLLVNRKQNISTVYQLLRDAAINENGTSSGGCLGGYSPGVTLLQSDQTFAPENIFWNPEEKIISKSCLSLWEKSLNLGWSLLRATLHYSPQCSGEEFRQHIETLRAEVKNALFEGNSSPGDLSGCRTEDQGSRSRGGNGHDFLDEYNSFKENNGAIHDILNRIMNKWRGGGETKKKPFMAESGEEELAAWASSNRLGEWKPSNELGNWAASDELGALPSYNESGALPSYNESGEKSFARETAVDNGSEQDDFLAKVTALKPERKI